jgi:hypothetical protein
MSLTGKASARLGSGRNYAALCKGSVCVCEEESDIQGVQKSLDTVFLLLHIECHVHYAILCIIVS